jgi:hypothetical protein
MSILDLEHAALAPNRFIRYLTHETTAESAPEPYQIRFLARICDLGRSTIIKYYLVPGGRFLYTHQVDDDDGGLYLWDLGYNATSPAKRSPVVVLRLDNHAQQYPIGRPAATSDGMQLSFLVYQLLVTFRLSCMLCLTLTRLFLVVRSPPSKFMVYQANPQLPGSSFHLRNTLLLDDVEFEDAFIGGDTLFISCYSFFAVWNWVEGTGCRWNLFSGPPVEVSSEASGALDSNHCIVSSGE